MSGKSKNKKVLKKAVKYLVGSERGLNFMSMGRKKLNKGEKKIRISIWKAPNEIKKLGSEKIVKSILSDSFDQQLGIIKPKK